MTRRAPWLRLDADADQHPRIAELRDGLKPEQADSACWAWVRLLMALKRSGEARFRSEAHLKHALGESYRWVKRLREVGLLEKLEIPDWESYQRPDPNAVNRTRAYRERTAGVSDTHVVRDEALEKRPDGDGDGDGDGDKDQRVSITSALSNLPAHRPLPRGGKPQAIGAILKGARR